MYEQILAALNEALAVKEQEIKYWHDRAEAMEVRLKQYARQADESEVLRCKHVDELDALYASNAELRKELSKREAAKALLHEVEQVLKRCGEEAAQDGGADPDGEPGE